LIAAVMMGAAVVVLILNRSAATEILGSIAFLGGVAVVLNAILDLKGGDDD
jgi:hypothetical protein